MRTENIKLLLVVVGAIIIGYMIYSYNKTSTESFVDLEGNNYPEIAPPSDVTNTGYGAYSSNAAQNFSGANQEKLDYANPNVLNQNVSEPSGNIPCNAPRASEPVGDNEVCEMETCTPSVTGVNLTYWDSITKDVEATDAKAVVTDIPVPTTGLCAIIL